MHNLIFLRKIEINCHKTQIHKRHKKIGFYKKDRFSFFESSKQKTIVFSIVFENN